MRQVLCDFCKNEIKGESFVTTITFDKQLDFPLKFEACFSCSKKISNMLQSNQIKPTVFSTGDIAELANKLQQWRFDALNSKDWDFYENVVHRLLTDYVVIPRIKP